MKKIAFYTLFSLSFFLGSCSSDDATDTEQPKIILLEPEDHEGFLPGSEIHLEALLTDNDGLASYKIEIHAAEDGHTHARTQTNYFQFEQANVLLDNPKVYELNQKITIPEMQNGAELTNVHYHLGIFVLDKSGNQEQVFVEIYIGTDADEHHHD